MTSTPRPSRVGMVPGARGIILPGEYRLQMRALLAREGERNACKILQVSRATLARLMGGMTCVAAVVAHVRTRLDEVGPRAGAK